MVPCVRRTLAAVAVISLLLFFLGSPAMAKDAKRGWLGVMIQHSEGDEGVTITDVVDDGPAEKAGLEAGDVVLEFEGKKIETSRDLRRLAVAGVGMMQVGMFAIALTPRDIEILALFSQETGRILGRRRLLKEIWGYPDPDRVETRSVDMQIAKLRKKLGFAAQDAGGPLQTVRGAGYRFRG